MAEPLEDSIIEERDEFMVSPSGDGNPTLRAAHFLKPSLPSTEKPLLELPALSLSFRSTISELKKLVFFKGRVYPPRKWKTWIEKLSPTYQSIWKKAGIYDAIRGSASQILRHHELVFGVAERWCSETNTFIFPWGEATITLEDVMILGGYSVLGDSVLSPLETKELLDIEENLIKARKLLTTQSAWMDHFMGSGNKIEHEAFLSIWLLRYVFPSNSYGLIRKHVFPIAVRLSRGIAIALAPALLASIYRDLSLLKAKIVASSKMKTDEDKDYGLQSPLHLWAPFQLVQLWAWERLPTLRPVPNLIKYGEPRSARWHKVRKLKIGNVRLAIDSAREYFQWRPYAAAVNNWVFHKFYGDKEEWVVVDSGLNIELQSFARCLRVCELVGLDCVEQYLPHRVAMQFGMDQDLPDCVPRSNQTPEIAWDNYNRPLRGAKLYITHRLFESDVTTRYLDWWKQLMQAQKDPIKGVVRKQRSSKSSRRSPQSCKGSKGDLPVPFTSIIPLDCNGEEAVHSDEDGRLVFEFLKSRKNINSVGNGLTGTASPLSGMQSQSSLPLSTDDGAVRRLESSINPVEKTVKEEDRVRFSERAMEDAYIAGISVDTMAGINSEMARYVGDDKLTDLELLKSSKNDQSFGNKLTCTVAPLSGMQSQSLLPSSTDYGAVRKLDSFIKPVENTIGFSERAMKDACKAGFPANSMVSINNCTGRNSSYSTQEIPGLELEARISKLEKVIAGLKARHGHIV